MKSLKMFLEAKKEKPEFKPKHNPHDVHFAPNDSYESADEIVFSHHHQQKHLDGKHPIYVAFSKKYQGYYHSHKPFDLEEHHKWEETRKD